MSRDTFEILWVLFLTGYFGLATICIGVGILIGPEKQDKENRK